MSLDDKAEQAAYNALHLVSQIPRPKERARICMEIIRNAANIAGLEIMEGVVNVDALGKE